MSVACKKMLEKVRAIISKTVAYGCTEGKKPRGAGFGSIAGDVVFDSGPPLRHNEDGKARTGDSRGPND